MSNRKRLAREKLEIYLVYLILAYRRLALICGALLLVYGALILQASPLAGAVSLALAGFTLLLNSSFRAVQLTARLGAWLGTLGRE
jgi:hypothetical protein